MKQSNYTKLVSFRFKVKNETTVIITRMNKFTDDTETVVVSFEPISSNVDHSGVTELNSDGIKGLVKDQTNQDASDTGGTK